MSPQESPGVEIIRIIVRTRRQSKQTRSGKTLRARFTEYLHGSLPREAAKFLTQFTLRYVKNLYAFYLVGLPESDRMSESRNDRSGDTVRLQRPPPRVFTDPCGHNVWMGDVEVLELEIEPTVSTDPYNSVVPGDL
jgi:hypothetical protein